MTRYLLSTVAALCCFGALPAGALADSVAIIRDCQDDQLDGTYSQTDLKQALKDIPADVDEYTDCRLVINAARLGTGDGQNNPGGGANPSGTPGGPGGGPGGGTAGANAGGQTAEAILSQATVQERQQVAAAIAQASGGGTTMIGGKRVSPQASGFSPDGQANRVPGPVVLVLILMAGALVTGGAQALRDLLAARHRTAH